MRAISFYIFFVLSFQAIGQSGFKYHFKCINAETKEAIPFTHFIVNDTLHSFTDMNGRGSLDFYPEKFEISHYFYGSIKVTRLDTNSHVFYMGRNDNKYQVSRSDNFSDSLIRLVLARKRYIRRSLKRVTYKSYNKFTVSTEKTGYTKRIYEKVLDLLAYDIEEQENQHLFLMESLSERQELDKLRKKERIVGIRSTGIKLPSTYTNFIHPHPFNVYSNYVSIANSKFISPLCFASYLTYAYELVDSAIVEGDPIYVLKFYPLPAKSISASQGFLYINGSDNTVKYFVTTPLKEGNARIEAAQEFIPFENTLFPGQYKTDIHLYNFGVGNAKLHLSANSYIFDNKRGVKMYPSEFSEIVLEYDSTSTSFPDSLWRKYRQDELTKKDLNTFHYYDSTGVQRKQEEVLKFGERLYLGQIPIGKINLELNKIFNLNYVEGLRLGLGFRTNELFSEQFGFGGYFGYGFKDDKLKYGVNAGYAFKSPIDLTVGASYKKDVLEAGAQFFPFDIIQYSTEPLRKYRLSVMDYYDQINVFATARPVKYLQVELGLSYADHKPSYEYRFDEFPDDDFDFAEYSLGLRYAFGEEYVKTPINTIFLGTPFPILWVNLTRGLPGVLGSDFSYSRIDAKIQQTFQFFRFGTSGIQIAAGYVNRSVPMTKLYNMKGSLRNFSVVIHNSFETMDYNEFLSDRFFAIFYSHDFGQLYTPSRVFRPNIVMLHNMGYGTLSHPEDHKDFEFKTMEKGYFESGIFLKNLIILNLGGLRTGFGLGLFARYGPYENDRLRDNMVIKLAANFLL